MFDPMVRNRSHSSLANQAVAIFGYFLGVLLSIELRKDLPSNTLIGKPDSPKHTCMSWYRFGSQCLVKNTDISRIRSEWLCLLGGKEGLTSLAEIG